jgi:cell division initiation protein
MDVTPQELRSSEIKDSWRGYDRDEVDDLLERAAVTIEHLTQQVHESTGRPVPAAAAATPSEVPLPSSREDAEMLQRTLLLAQRAADDAVNEAQARAKQMLDESEAKAQALVSDAEATARRIAEGERRRLESEILDLSARREQLRIDADALEEYVSGYRDRIRSAIEEDLANLSGDVEAPSPRPEEHEVELPAGRAPVPAAIVVEADEVVEPAAPLDGADDSWDAGPDTHAIEGLDPATSSPGSVPAEAAHASPVAAPPRPEAAAAEWPPPAPGPDAASAPAAESSWLGSDTDWTTSATAWDAPAPWETREPGQPEAFAADVPIEANRVDAEPLEDDAFFASLREAVRDDTPLGPRDDEQAAFYDESSEQERRRFRRRR